MLYLCVLVSWSWSFLFCLYSGKAVAWCRQLFTEVTDIVVIIVHTAGIHHSATEYTRGCCNCVVCTSCQTTKRGIPQNIPITWLMHALNEKKRSERHKHCTLAVVGGAKNFRPAADPLPGGAWRPKFNQLEMFTTCTYRPSLVKIDACIFELSWWQTPPTRPPATNTPTNTQTGPITIHCTAS